MQQQSKLCRLYKTLFELLPREGIHKKTYEIPTAIITTRVPTNVLSFDTKIIVIFELKTPPMLILIAR